MSMRSRARSTALVAVGVLAATIAGGAVTTAAPASSFAGDFDVIDPATGAVYGHIVANTSPPTPSRLIPGAYRFVGAPDFFIRETRAQIALVDFWYDPNHPWPDSGGSDVAFAEGVECIYLAPGDARCQPWAAMFIDVRDASLPDQVAFAFSRNDGGEWDFSVWSEVGNGGFRVRVAGS